MLITYVKNLFRGYRGFHPEVYSVVIYWFVFLLSHAHNGCKVGVRATVPDMFSAVPDMFSAVPDMFSAVPDNLWRDEDICVQSLVQLMRCHLFTEFTGVHRMFTNL